ncbi:phosphonate metabolism protein PhnM [Pseudooceanicola sediminis]|uniref:Phosphonate metabolism protein PhnM n=1 Tax=Pseudooceanicola sediminis TaxID=2211117 RepID=A0A399IZV8_9RHOB|nr:amidohydrolase family protein [Pseudooceanicola sediminis]KAA2313876.1 amidohydrolase family protein [Puniceibacterium sp. HSS470]RII38693.1 phosphonate metabolism protein PhnM [Pseudooceanicola sediminis]|tara:strand:+ start:64688 stop:65929 length:1242 start_codon:yes stop_codon:yes gene_type:complete
MHTQTAGETPALLFQGAQVILPDRMVRCSVRTEGDLITGLDRPRDGARVIDASGLILAPAMVDIHGDAFERQLMPRPEVFFPLDLALLETDRQLAGNGIATAYHALTLSWEPGLRSVARARQVVDQMAALAPRLRVDNRLQLRWETFCFEARPLIEQALSTTPRPALAFNDHTSMALLHPDTPLQDRPFDHDPAFPVTDTTSAAFAQKITARAQRSGVSRDDYVQLITRIWERRPDVPAAIDAMARAGRAAGVPMLSHDDTQLETRRFYRDRGAAISEFPMRRAVARAAREAGDFIVFGAPNVVRGTSHIGSPSARDMVQQGLCDILASDYFYPAMLAAVARMRADGIAVLSELWKLVSHNPAVALGLHDRGRIAPGARADLVLLDWPEGGAPAPLLTLSGGRIAHAGHSFGL